ncbi:MAG: DUF1223 domain-containing protein [Chitinophagaceae bacterium]|nr:MAG: DUF1223 domain-containing protein [Chitinophagaceae bacterium]
MKRIKITVVVALALSVTTATFSVNKSAASRSRDIAGDGFAILELFTSEGCSSCPPADDLLGRLQEEAGTKPVYVLSYHVDYWDQNGWKDVFSNPAFTKRQYDYSRRFNDQVYTPQVIVNGKIEFVGSNEKTARKAISNALATPASRSLLATAIQKGQSLQISYEVSGKADGVKLMLAVVQKHAMSKIKAGENEGRTLSHPQIVRDLHSVALRGEGKASVQIPLPADFDATSWEVIGFLQEKETGEIYAAERIAIAKP